MSIRGKHFAGFDFDQSNKDIQEEENMLFFQTHPRNTLLKSIVLIKCSVSKPTSFSSIGACFCFLGMLGGACGATFFICYRFLVAFIMFKFLYKTPYEPF